MDSINIGITECHGFLRCQVVVWETEGEKDIKKYLLKTTAEEALPAMVGASSSFQQLPQRSHFVAPLLHKTRPCQTNTLMEYCILRHTCIFESLAHRQTVWHISKKVTKRDLGSSTYFLRRLVVSELWSTYHKTVKTHHSVRIHRSFQEKLSHHFTLVAKWPS